jgi:uncharacterized protein (TIGR01777 family)
MRVVIAGGTGFIGRRLLHELLAGGDEVHLLLRTDPGDLPRGIRTTVWDGRTMGDWVRELEGTDAIINLAGAPLAGGRWTERRRDSLRRSRIEPTRLLVEAAGRMRRSPRVLVNGSAVGIYGDVPEGTVTEGSPHGSGFLADLCSQWEEAARAAKDFGLRVVLPRPGLVLGAEGGALKKMLAPFRFFVGGVIGTGRQWVPWIHQDDMVGILRSALREEWMEGPINATAPDPVRMEELAEAIGEVLRSPAWLSVPPLPLKLAFGEMSSVLLTGQRAVPTRLLGNGYSFRFPQLKEALRSLFRPS